MAQSERRFTDHGDTAEQDGVLYRYTKNTSRRAYREVHGGQESPKTSTSQVRRTECRDSNFLFIATLQYNTEVELLVKEIMFSSQINCTKNHVTYDVVIRDETNPI